MKILTSLGILSLVLLSSCTQSTTEVDSTSTSNPVTSTIQTERGIHEWKEINHENFWNNSGVIRGGGYAFPEIAFSYPENWEFECCGDIDSASFHLLYPKGEMPWKNPAERNFLELPKTFPSITITSRIGDTIMMGGSIEKPDYWDRDTYINSFGTGDEIPTPVQSWRIKKVMGSDFVDYFIKTDDGLVTFRFNNIKLFESGFEEKFIKLLAQSKSSQKVLDTITLSAGESSGYNPFITGPVEPPRNGWIANGGVRSSNEGPMYNNPMEFWKSEREYIESTRSGANIRIAYEKGYSVFMKLSGSGMINIQEGGTQEDTMSINGAGLYKIGDDSGMSSLNYRDIVFPAGIQVYSIQLKR